MIAGTDAVRPGDALPIRLTKVGAAPMRIMAEVLCDPNPIHLDPVAAAAAGLGDRVINQGPANLAYIFNMLREAFPQYRIASFDSRFLANVRDGDIVEAGGVVRSVDAAGILCDAWLRSTNGTDAVRASALLAPRGDGLRGLAGLDSDRGCAEPDSSEMAGAHSARGPKIGKSRST